MCAAWPSDDDCDREVFDPGEYLIGGREGISPPPPPLQSPDSDQSDSPMKNSDPYESPSMLAGRSRSSSGYESATSVDVGALEGPIQFVAVQIAKAVREEKMERIEQQQKIQWSTHGDFDGSATGINFVNDQEPSLDDTIVDSSSDNTRRRLTSYKRTPKRSQRPPCTFCFNNARYRRDNEILEWDEKQNGGRPPPPPLTEAEETDAPWKFHALEMENGDVCCPVLFRFVCTRCGATGRKAHTDRYCKKKKPIVV